MARAGQICYGLAAGAALMYFFDPDRGRRRRVLMRDRTIALGNDCRAVLRKAQRDVANRAEGLAAAARTLVQFRRPPADDEILEARVRSKMGRFVSHPHAIEVSCREGKVTLRGPILQRELESFLKAVRAIPGVREVENQLEVYEHPGTIPALQGESPRPGETPEILQASWTPAVRVLGGAAGGALAIYGAAKRDPLGAVAGLLGAGLLARAITNMELSRMLGLKDGAKPLVVQKSITIKAPVEEVWRLWTHYENFPLFMSHIREVKDLGGGRSHWVVDGPAGISLHWDAEITRQEPTRLLAWRSLPGSQIDHEGTLRFEPTPEGHTRVHFRISYSPPAGVVGHAVAWLLGRDLKTELDEDMVRFKSLIEEGKTRAPDGHRVTKSELEGVTPEVTSAAAPAS